ncbi:hypothetical protein BJ165DRAFT_1605009 [Panaeolus papilionaceus]|nr:hypothetical protein BJ165DRAFT_1605009 [Panaeolus papilionaceus]
MVLLYDYCLTCEIEINYIRTTPWTVLKVLYIISRYSVFIDVSLNMWREFNHTATDSECLLYYKATIWLSAVGLAACEVLLSLRLCAVYEMRRTVICSISGLFIVTFSCELILLDHWLRTVEGEMVSNRGAHLTGCILYTNSTLFHTIWVLLLVYDSVLFFMIALKGHSFIFKRSISGMRLTAVVYRKGMLYDLYLFAISVFNVILFEKVTYTGPISSVQRVMHSVRTSRLILSIRQTANFYDSFWGTTRDVISKYSFVQVSQMAGKKPAAGAKAQTATPKAAPSAKKQVATPAPKATEGAAAKATPSAKPTKAPKKAA